MTRKTALKLLLAGIAAPFVPTSKPRCDADAIEARLRKGEMIDGESFVLRRAIRVADPSYPKGCGLINCHLYCAEGAVFSLV